LLAQIHDLDLAYALFGAPRRVFAVGGKRSGLEVSVEDTASSLLEVLRDRLGARSPKDGCSPQGQCGCCTVWVEGAPRVACVTPARRVAGRSVTTLEGLEPAERRCWAEAFSATGASQCGFCTPGIVMRLAALRRRGDEAPDEASVGRALAAHLCRCTGYLKIFEAIEKAAEKAAEKARA